MPSVSKYVEVEVEIEVEIEVDDLNDFEAKELIEELYEAGYNLSSISQIQHLIMQAQVETTEMKLPPYLRELLQTLTQRDFGLPT